VVVKEVALYDMMSAHIRGAAKAVDRIASAARRLVVVTKGIVICGKG
jgi:hypothetical protein